MPWMQSVFYVIGAVIIAIIAIAAYRLARGTNKRDPLLWTIFVVMLVTTAWTGTELATLFLLAGLLVLLVRAWPGASSAVALSIAGVAAAALIVGLERALSTSTASGDQHALLQILVFFTKAGSFVFGSGLAIVPFLQQGVVHDMAWLTEHQFLDAVAVALITPGPVVITVAFIGYLVEGVAGATVAAVGIFLPVYFFTILPAPWFRRHRDNLQLRAFAAGATTAASGAIAGAVVVLGQGAISDLATACIALTGLVLLVRYRIPEPLASQLRTLVAVHDARFALLPLEVAFEKAAVGTAGGRARLRLAIVDARTTELRWVGEVRSDPSPVLNPGVTTSLAGRLADLIVAR